MSTKIYEAYRTKLGVDIGSMVPHLRKKAEAGAKECLRILYEEVAKDVDTTTERFQKILASSKDDRLARLTIAQEVIGREYKAQAASDIRSSFNLDVSLAIRHHEGRFYIIPHVDTSMRNALEFLKHKKKLEAYPYWNNTDKPKNVTEKQWKLRGDTWRAMFENWQDVLVLHVVDVGSFYMTDIGWPMIRERIAEMKAEAL
jgi:hypothetical protein